MSRCSHSYNCSPWNFLHFLADFRIFFLISRKIRTFSLGYDTIRDSLCSLSWVVSVSSWVSQFFSWSCRWFLLPFSLISFWSSGWLVVRPVAVTFFAFVLFCFLLLWPMPWPKGFSLSYKLLGHNLSLEEFRARPPRQEPGDKDRIRNHGGVLPTALLR